MHERDHTDPKVLREKGFFKAAKVSELFQKLEHPAGRVAVFPIPVISNHNPANK